MDKIKCCRDFHFEEEIAVEAIQPNTFTTNQETLNLKKGSILFLTEISAVLLLSPEAKSPLLNVVDWEQGWGVMGVGDTWAFYLRGFQCSWTS